MALFNGIQTFSQEMGEAACYAFCIMKIAEIRRGYDVDVFKELQTAIDRKWIAYDWENPNNPNNMFVERPDLFLSYLLGGNKPVSVVKASVKPSGGGNTAIVECWANTHFRLPGWDSLVKSQSVLKGKITSWRVFTIG